MSIESLKSHLLSGPIDIVDARARIQTEFDAATSSEEREAVLAIFTIVMDHTEQQLAAQSDKAQLLDDFKKARLQDYKIFLVQECTVGLDLPEGGNVSVDMLMAVTDREIAAGRMTEDFATRKIAVQQAAEPHFSHAELVAQYTERRAELAAADSSAHRIGAALGRKFKGLFGK